ncbi:Pkinase-domain-containing protein [Hypoxylon crocopeplum]|nr:Pkinase-domain-containing protein [Hypoxylon crocopeplum]
MTDRRGSKSRSSRAPLGDATERVNNTLPTKAEKPIQAQAPQPNPLRAHPTNNHTHKRATSTASGTTKPDKPQARKDPHALAAPQNVQQGDRRVSQASAASSLGRRKTHIGPWELGKTLGQGSAARVRLVRHNATRELAAVKILCKDGSFHTQPGSIAALDQWDRSRKEFKSENRIPFAIEREIAIMKLIDHPNVIKLYDIWENRSEIYLVMEYVPEGDLYSYIVKAAPLSEVEGMSYFRQLLSAVEYVHSFNICHRDLKPENILITEGGQVKITDFGMSAMHQGPNHRLRTSCGSPHYAAPELLKMGPYRGEQSDIWSLGVILYGLLSNSLPFSDSHVPTLLEMIKKGTYKMPLFLSHEAQDLIARILVADPNVRLNSAQIWQHPLVRRYDHLDDYNKKDRTLNYRVNARYDAVPPEEVDKHTLRQLKSVMHTYSEQELAWRLSGSEPNEFKLFYWLLYNYREKRLENYGTDMTFSPSDYHHLQPPNWKKKYTTLEFPSKNGRSTSRFTVISNVATDENGETLERSSTDGSDTVKSYDPYKSSFAMEDMVASQARIVIHRNGTSSTRTSKAPTVRNGSARTNSTYSQRRAGGRHGKAPATLRGSRRSLNSIRSGEEISYKRPVTRQKRGIDFSRSNNRHHGGVSRPASIAGDDTTYERDHSLPTSPAKRNKLSRKSGRGHAGTQSLMNVSRIEDNTLHWNEELRKFSNSIAQDCDEAFNSSLLTHESYLSGSPFESPVLGHANSSFDRASTPTPTAHGARQGNPDLRGLPPSPPPKDSDVHAAITAKKRGKRRRDEMSDSSEHVDEMTSQLNRLAFPGGPYETAEADRRIVSAPIYSQFSTQWGKDKIPLPSINETPREEDYFGDGDKSRAVSAPARPSSSRPATAKEGVGLEHLALNGTTIRVVDSLSNRPSKVATPATPNGHKELPVGRNLIPQVRQGLTLRQQYLKDGVKASVSDQPTAPTSENPATSVKKKASWFKRGSKGKEDIFDASSMENTDELSRTDTNSSSGQPEKKKSFDFAFWRRSKEQPEMKLSLAGSDFDDASEPETARMFSHPSRPPHNKRWKDKPTKAVTRNIEPQQSWFARLFRVKPATRHLCFSISRRRVRQEIAILLKEWRRHGMKDIVVDKERNLVFARVSKKNHLNLKESSFAAEIMTVIEHGKRNQLCIVRFTQERGAATTFYKVINAMDEIFTSRGLLVADKYKVKKMMETLNS